MQIDCNFQFDHQTLYIDHQTWSDLMASGNEFALITTFTTIKNVLNRNGSVKLLTSDRSSIKRSIDRQSEIDDLLNEVNKIRQTVGLDQIVI